MATNTGVTIYHNPACGTSRNVLGLIRAAGVEPRVIEYVKAGWDRPTLEGLFARMGVKPRDVLRVRGTPAEALGLTAQAATDEQIMTAMVEHPIMVERPIVDTGDKAALCRPAERVAGLLQS